LEELGQWVGCHVVIVSRVNVTRKILAIHVAPVAPGIRVICPALRSAV
jgi:hypothetical protein